MVTFFPYLYSWRCSQCSNLGDIPPKKSSRATLNHYYYHLVEFHLQGWAQLFKKLVIKSIRKLTRIRNNGTIQLQFFHRCIVCVTGSKVVNGLPCFSRITFRLTKSIRIIRCFRSFDVIVYCISQLFVLCPVAWII